MKPSRCCPTRSPVYPPYDPDLEELEIEWDDPFDPDFGNWSDDPYSYHDHDDYGSDEDDYEYPEDDDDYAPF